MYRLLRARLLLPAALLSFAGNSGFMVGVSPCPMHGTPMVSHGKMDMGSQGMDGGTHSSHTARGCDCGGRCGTTPAIVVIPGRDALVLTIAIETRSSRPLQSIVASSPSRLLPFPTGPPAVF